MSVRRIDDVLGNLDAIITRAVADGDRVGYFAVLYRKVTLALKEAIIAGEFVDGERLERLDVAFAIRYFDALEAYRKNEPVTESWRIAFEACRERDPTILQHLYAGLAAHQLLDLGIAAAETAPGPRIDDLRRDFEHINDIVARLMREVNATIGAVSPWIGIFDRVAGIHYAALNKIGISVARDVAWRSAVRLAPLEPPTRVPIIERMDGRTALIARNLVHPRGGLGMVARAIRAREPDDVGMVIRALSGAPRSTRRRRARRVAVLGAGVGGLTAAHELIERGYEVDVYDAAPEAGGKSKSQSLRGTGTGGRRDLPGEHGFRFFPSFYCHIIETMRRIPVPGGRSVAERIVKSDEMAMAEKNATYVFKRHPPRGVGDVLDIATTVRDFFKDTAVPEKDFARFAHTLLTFMVSCDARRYAQHEKISFWDWVDGSSYHPAFQKYLETPRFMVAMDPRAGSARTIATKAVQILSDFFRHGTRTDGVLDGPTSERWLEPWVSHLTERGVRFHYGAEVERLPLGRSARLASVRLRGGRTIDADHYVLALPLDMVVPLITEKLAAADPALAGIRRLRGATSWMVGAQFFFDRPLGMCKGHIAFPDSHWALSAIAQAQFWPGGVAGYGDGRVRDILSVDISDWDTPSPRIGKSARACTKAELMREIWDQLDDALVIDRRHVIAEHLDENIVFGPGGSENRSPLLVHPPGSWFDRPGADLRIDNLFLASDYVKTNTDLASMEGANEAARRAVNAILETDASAERPCRIWSMAEETGRLIGAARRLDREIYLVESHGGPALRIGGILGDLRRRLAPTTLAGVRAETEELSDVLKHVSAA
jgi:15-cis-phytoene desaturase